VIKSEQASSPLRIFSPTVLDLAPLQVQNSPPAPSQTLNLRARISDKKR
jgi:hypothetical protein